MYHYAGNNPVKYVDPDGLEVQLTFYVFRIVENEYGGKTAYGVISVYNIDTGNSFLVNNVKSGGIGLPSDKETNTSNPAPFGTYDILETTKEGKLYHRLEAHDNNYGDEVADFEGQEKNSLLRLHYRGGCYTWGCV